MTAAFSLMSISQKHFRKTGFYGLLLAFILFGQGAEAMSQGGQPPKLVESFTLDNGMQVVVIPDHRAPIVTHMVWYHVGAADDPKGQSGLAHFLEHLLFKRTEKLAENEFSQIVARNGGQHNAFTSSDYTAYYQTVAVDRLPLMMELESDRMVNLILDEQDVLSERDVILEERSMRTDSNPQALLSEKMAAALYKTHPYGVPIIGWRSEMETLSLENAREFYRKYYNPAAAVLIVAGDVTVAQVGRLAQKYYGPIAGHKLPVRVRPQETRGNGAAQVDFRDVRVQQPIWIRSYLAPSYTSGAREHAYALDVLSQLLGNGINSRLYQKLVVEDKIAVAAGSGYSSTSYDRSKFTLYAVPRPGLGDSPEQALEILQKAVDGVVQEMLETGVTSEEVERVKASLVAEAIYARDSITTMAQLFGTELTTGSTIEATLNWPNKISSITLEQINTAAKFVFDINSSVTGRLLPQKKEPAQ